MLIACVDVASRRTVTSFALRLAVLLLVYVLAVAGPAKGQELEARTYSASPIDTNFAVGIFSNSTGDVSLDLSLPLSGIRPSIDTISLSYTHTFRLAGRTASWAVFVPYLGAHVTAALYGREQSGTRYGFPDARARLAINFLGRALTPAEFARKAPSTTLGASLTVIVPTGTYDPTRFINVGSNRWSFKPEIGAEIPMGKWFADLSAGLWLFGDNTNYFEGHVLAQSPLAIYQIHTGYTFRPGQWIAVDGNYYAGGSTSVSGAKPLNALSNVRYGLTFSQPIGAAFSTKLSWSRWASGEYGQRFTTIAAALQYRWFDANRRR